MKVTIKTKIIGLSIGPAVAGALIIGAIVLGALKIETANQLEHIKDTTKSEIVDSLKGQVETAIATITTARQNGLDEAQQLKIIEGLRYGQGGYFWIQERNPAGGGGVNIVMHPIKPDLNGAEVSGLKDSTKFERVAFNNTIYDKSAPEVAEIAAGKNIFSEFDKKAAQGGGEVGYYWPHPEKEKDVGYLKLSYVAAIPGTNWVIGTGAYADRIDAAVLENTESLSKTFSTIIGWVALGLLLVIGSTSIASLVLTKQLISPIRGIEAAARKMATGDLNNVPDLIDSGDEIGAMAMAIKDTIEVQKERAALAQSISEGDLTQNVKVNNPEDMLGNALKRMAESLTGTVAHINTVSQDINSGALQLSDSSQALSQGATEQAASVEEISSSMTELEDQTKQNAENANMASTLSIQTRDNAEKGSTHMVSLVNAMSQMGESSKEISKIIKVIDDIAFQTNLLALNAAVEAARAGKYGKGFAVVAEEVRSLAARSAKAAKETSELIENSVSSMSSGIELSETTAAALNEIVEHARKSADVVSEIAASSQEQAQGISQINAGLEQIDKVTQQNTANAEETASSSDDLRKRSDDLRQSIEWFKTKSSARNYASKPSTKASNAYNRTTASPMKHKPVLSGRPKVTRSPNAVRPHTVKPTPAQAPDPKMHADRPAKVTPPPLDQSYNKNEEIISLDDDNWGRY